MVTNRTVTPSDQRRTWFVHFAWALCSIFLTVFSYKAGNATQPAASGNVPPFSARGLPEVALGPDASPASSEPSEQLLAALQPEDARARAFALLSQPKRIERLRGLCDLLDLTTKENWRSIRDAFIQQSVHEGRKHDLEWSLMLERMGEVAGEDLMAELVNGATPRERLDASRCMEGWVAADPATALEWFQSQPSVIQDAHWPGFFRGLGRSDPRRAARLLQDQNKQVWEPTLNSVLEGAFEHGGFQAAEQLIDDVMALPELDLHFKRKIVYEVGQRRLESARLSGDAAAPLEWFDRFLQPDSPIGPAITGEVVSAAAGANARVVMQWLDQRESRMTSEQSAAAYLAGARALQQQSPSEMAAWLVSNPQHPQHAAILQALAETRASGELDQRRPVQPESR